ncbi:hypothetical protein LAZ67_5003969 [Cordylochernes scorpioides]|uniref:Reverse transcriptase domain-containing protein n=1 Tax=Cordylochernes scorpioides TaxID=51811 RepID=A0ABY6KL71_9ARAC|nr:hypothetical protein LAZ67_5003969 [Cordylochernes scorpioides]
MEMSQRNERRANFSYEDTNVTKNLTKGCPQGGPISPILWNILLNDLLKSFKHPNAEIICYADDVSIICWSKCVEDLKILSEYILCYVMQWCNRNKLSISPEKTNLLYLHNKSKVPIEISNIILNPVDQVKILGIKFSNHRIKKKINFTPHINDILCRIVTKLGFTILIQKQNGNLLFGALQNHLLLRKFAEIEVLQKMIERKLIVTGIQQNASQQYLKKIKQSRPRAQLRGVLLHHDNAKPHTSAQTLDFLANSDVQLVTHPPYSPYLESCDFFYFQKGSEVETVMAFVKPFSGSKRLPENSRNQLNVDLACYKDI